MEHDKVLDDLGIAAHPIHRLPPIRCILFDVADHELSVSVVEAERRNLRKLGFAGITTRQRFDPNVGHITEYWGTHEDR